MIGANIVNHERLLWLMKTLLPCLLSKFKCELYRDNRDNVVCEEQWLRNYRPWSPPQATNKGPRVSDTWGHIPRGL